MEPFEDDKLVAALESLRPAPRPTFAAELDERAAAGFPRRSRLAGSRLGRFAEWIGALNPRRALIPAGATALAAIAAVTVVVAVSENGSPVSEPSDTFGLTSPNSDLDSGAPSTGTAEPNLEGGGAPEAEVQDRANVPSGAETELAVPSSGASAASATAKTPPPDTGPYASQAPHREIERSARMVLGTDPANVRRAASDVFTTVHAYRGIVLDSSIHDGAEGDAGARFMLLIPSAKLGDALADFSAIAEVRSRHEATADITAPTVRTGEQLRDSQAKIESLLTQLATADTEAERSAAEALLLRERRRVAALRSRLATLERRANLSRVSLRIETGEAGAPSDESGNWGVGKALDDAGEILAIAAGVTIIALAILGPVALIALIAWLVYRAHVRRSRQRALA